jgi:hypothetical protein
VVKWNRRERGRKVGEKMAAAGSFEEIYIGK